ncbi:MAG: hypothetical protein ACJA2D_002163 [Pseudohongiellaceae bacterium]|jgi:hypothetical protein
MRYWRSTLIDRYRPLNTLDSVAIEGYSAIVIGVCCLFGDIVNT